MKSLSTESSPAYRPAGTRFGRWSLVASGISPSSNSKAYSSKRTTYDPGIESMTIEKRPRCYFNRNRHYSHLPSTTEAAAHSTIIAAGPEDEQQIAHVRSTSIDPQATFQPHIPTARHHIAQPLEVAIQPRFGNGTCNECSSAEHWADRFEIKQLRLKIRELESTGASS
jgi:hypothetical protein